VSEHSLIAWTDATWNPVVGCERVSPGCTHCYAIRDARRLGSNPHPAVQAAYHDLVHKTAGGQLDWTGEVRCLPERLEQPLAWRRPKRIFVNSQSDLFHDDVPEAFIRRVFAVMAEASWHQFQVLTKRAERLEQIGASLSWPANVWQGVSVENAAYAWRADHLRRTGARVKFLSVEPLLGPLPEIDLTGIDWVIVGGESGPGARPMQAEWAEALLARCRSAGVRFFFKQAGRHLAQAWGCSDAKGTTAAEIPERLRVRELPIVG
jgi:protein gp37